MHAHLVLNAGKHAAITSNQLYVGLTDASLPVPRHWIATLPPSNEPVQRSSHCLWCRITRRTQLTSQQAQPNLCAVRAQSRKQKQSLYAVTQLPSGFG